MKKTIIPILLFVLLLGGILSGCDDSKITITVASNYQNEIADESAEDKTTDEEGNTVYTFEQAQYINYLSKLMKEVKTEFRSVISDTATYSYLNENGTELVVGIDPDKYNEAKCNEQAQKVGEIAVLYNVSTLEHTGSVTVIYENAFTGKEIFKTEISA